MALDSWPRVTGGTTQIAAELAEREKLDCKFCPTCKTVKKCEAFARWSRGRDGLQTQCKACNAAYRKTAAYRASDRRYSLSEKGRVVDAAAHRRYLQTEKGKSKVRRATRKNYEMYPERCRARKLVYDAIQRGSLVRQLCENCGTTHVEAHHHNGYDAEHALDVRWLCSPCHRAEHKEFADAVG